MWAAASGQLRDTGYRGVQGARLDLSQSRTGRWRGRQECVAGPQGHPAILLQILCNNWYRISQQPLVSSSSPCTVISVSHLHGNYYQRHSSDTATPLLTRDQVSQLVTNSQGSSERQQSLLLNNAKFQDSSQVEGHSALAPHPGNQPPLSSLKNALFPLLTNLSDP